MTICSNQARVHGDHMKTTTTHHFSKTKKDKEGIIIVEELTGCGGLK